MDLWDFKAIWVKDCLDLLMIKEQYRLIKNKERRNATD